MCSSDLFSKTRNAAALLAAFRDRDLPIIGRIENDRFLLDLKAVETEDLPALTEAIRSVLG